MVNEEILNKMYEGIIEGEELTTKKLNEYGFNSKDLKELVNDGILSRVKKGWYEFIKVDGLIVYSKKLIENKETEKLTKCYEAIFKINPNIYGVNIKLFYYAIKIKDYEKALMYLECCFKLEKYKLKDNNFYLYLLNEVAELPKEHREYLKNSPLSAYIDCGVEHFNTYEKMKISSLNGRFHYSLNQLKEFYLEKDKKSLNYIILNTLIYQIINKKVEDNNELCTYVENGQYEELVKYYENLKSKHFLKGADIYRSSLVDDLIRIIKKGIIPKINQVETEDLFEAIDNHDYELAYSLSKKWCQQKEINETLITLLLEKIVKVIKEIESKNIKLEENELIEKKEDNTPLVDFSSIISHLMKQEIDDAFNLIHLYLEKMGRSEYEFLVLDLIKISLLEKDSLFSKATSILSHLTKEDFTFDCMEYVEYFNEALKKGKYEEARVYLDIISKGNDLGYLCLFLENLKRNLEEKENKALEKAVEDKKIKNNADIEDLIEKNLEKLKQNGIVILKPMKKEKIENINKIVKKYPNIDSFVIGEEPLQQVVFRYYEREYVSDAKGLFKKANNAFKNCDYESSISIYRDLLKSFRTPSIFIYSGLGFSYLKIDRRKLAILYLTVATELNKKANLNSDYTELILKLKNKRKVNNKEEDEDRKIYFEMDISEFDGDNLTTNTPYLEEITELVVSGYTLTDAMSEFELTSEEKDTIILLFARSYYSRKNTALGNKLMKLFEQSKEKTSTTKDFYQEILANKKLYQKGVGEDYISYLIRKRQK